MTSPEPNSVEVYVRDAVGGIFCHSCSRIEYEASAIEHARWWARRGRPGACRPLKVVVERYHDASQTPKRRRR